ncbi:alcohol dehydrogenase superfamily protein [Mycena galopus ATCC 62051]|nr:alcohol dehydrogenase superfamily protein [Mycena galopus ATCC 62051]
MSLPTTTRQYFYPKIGSYDNLALQEVPVRGPKANEVLVKTHAVSLQFRDLMVANGTWSEKLPQNLVPGSDMAGEVIAVGEAVKEWKVGDRICSNLLQAKLHKDSPTAQGLGGAVHGVLTQYRTFPAETLVAVPDHLSYEEASTLPCAALTAYNALFSGFEPVKAGDTVLIQGTGGTSIAEVAKLTNGVGVDHVVEVAGNATLAQSIEAVKAGGSIDLVGVVGSIGDVPPADIILSAIFKELNIRGISIGSVIQFKNMNRLISANIEATRPVIDKVFGFEDLKTAYAHLASQTHVGKVVIKF